jgi:GNAT superfamily N-acetyltransferase
MQIVSAGSQHVWRVMDYLQRDAASKGALRKDDDVQHLTFSSFWHNMDEFMPAFRQTRLYVVLDARNRLLAYCIARESLEYDGREGTLPIDIFEVLPRYRKKGVGSFMVSWLKERACTAGFNSLQVCPANGSNTFWEKNGFSTWEYRHGLTCPLQ